MSQENLKPAASLEETPNTSKIEETEQNKKRLSEDLVKLKKNTRRRLSISTTDETPSENDEVKRSIRELQENVCRFEETGEDEDEKAKLEKAAKQKEEQLRLEKERKEKEKEEKEKEKTEMKIVKIKEVREPGFMKRNIHKRSSVAGTRAMYYQDDFEKKCVKIKGCVEGLSENGVGYVCRKGLKPESPNQDDFIVIMMENLALYAIFDGHGPYGHEVSNYVQKELPYMIIQNDKFLDDPKKIFHAAFMKIHEYIEKGTKEYLKSISNVPNTAVNINPQTNRPNLQGVPINPVEEEDDDSDYAHNFTDDSDEENNKSKNAVEDKDEKNKKRRKPHFDSTMSGTTATIIVHMFNTNKLYVAYVGDSRAVIGKRKKDSNTLRAVDLTVDHKPNLEEEKTRITKSGGEVLKLEGDIPHRVFIKNKFYPGLAMSRAIGDTIGHRIGIISEPDYNEININEDEDVLVLVCSDGVWEFISSEEAINIVYKFGYSNVQEAVEHLAKEAWDRWLNEEENIVDDITVQAFYLSNKLKDKK